MRALAIHLGALGDLIRSLPAIAALRESLGAGGEVDLWANGPPRDLVVGRSAVARARPFERPGISRLFGDAPLAPDDSIARDVLAFDRLVVFVRGSAATEPLLRNLEALAPGRVEAIDPKPPPTGIPVLELVDGDRRAASAWLAAAGLAPPTRVLACHPGASARGKQWPAERFAAVCRDAAARLGLAPLVVTGPVEAERDDVARAIDSAFASAGPPVPARLDAPPLPLLAAILARAAVYLGNDSGVTHLAAAVGAPVVAIFGPSDAAVWGPRGRAAVRVLRAPCAPACDPRDPDMPRKCPDLVCLAGVSEAEIARAVAEIAR